MVGEQLKQFVIEGTRKKSKVHHDNLALLKRKHGVGHEEESDKELEN